MRQHVCVMYARVGYGKLTSPVRFCANTIQQKRCNSKASVTKEPPARVADFLSPPPVQSYPVDPEQGFTGNSQNGTRFWNIWATVTPVKIQAQLVEGRGKWRDEGIPEFVI